MKRLLFSKTMEIVKKPTSKNPLVSIIIIALNEEKNILNVLQSLRRQTFSDMEIILADGFSEDKTIEIAQPLVDGIICESRRNPAFERNAGALLARGKILAFADSDNILPKKWVENIVVAFNSNPKIVGVWGSVYFSDTNLIEKIISKIAMRVFCFIESIKNHVAPACANYAFRKDIFFNIDGFDTSYRTCEDHEIFQRLKKEGEIKYSPKIEVCSSARRIKAMGYLNFLRFQTKNMKQFYQTGQASKKYENIR